MKAQILYDLREKYEFCSGTDLHEFFQEQVGDPSPSGEGANVGLLVAQKFVYDCCAAIEHNSGISMADCQAAFVKAAYRN